MNEPLRITLNEDYLDDFSSIEKGLSQVVMTIAHWVDNADHATRRELS